MHASRPGLASTLNQFSFIPSATLPGAPRQLLLISIFIWGGLTCSAMGPQPPACALAVKSNGPSFHVCLNISNTSPFCIPGCCTLQHPFPAITSQPLRTITLPSKAQPAIMSPFKLPAITYLCSSSIGNACKPGCMPAPFTRPVLACLRLLYFMNALCSCTVCAQQQSLQCFVQLSRGCCRCITP